MNIADNIREALRQAAQEQRDTNAGYYFLVGWLRGLASSLEESARSDGYVAAEQLRTGDVIRYCGHPHTVMTDPRPYGTKPNHVHLFLRPHPLPDDVRPPVSESTTLQRGYTVLRLSTKEPA